LIVWQKSVQLVQEVFLLTKHFPNSELYGLTSQIKRAAISIPSNIAEGYGRRSTKEYAQFYSIAYGSGLELETQITIAKKLGLCSLNHYEKIEPLLEEVLRMLNKITFNNMKLDPKR